MKCVYQITVFIICVVVFVCQLSHARKITDGGTTATAFYDGDKFSVKVGTLKNGCAVGSYLSQLSSDSNGWGWLNITSSTAYSYAVQAQCAGLVEGFLTQQAIEDYGTNQYAEWGFTPSTMKSKNPDLYSYMQASLSFASSGLPLSSSGGGETDSVDKKLWDEVSVVMAQLNGLSAGYELAGGTKYSLFDLYVLNAAGDMETLTGVFKNQAEAGMEKQIDDFGALDCSAVVRLTDDDLIMAHATWRQFMLMNRIYKQVSLNGETAAFSSSGSFLSSKDDWYITGHDLAVYETTNSIFNATLYSLYVQPKTLLTWVRTIAANRATTTGSDWVDMFARWNSGTYNNQFGVVDMKLYSPGQTTESDLFWIIEQIPGFTQSRDVTDVLNDQGYWPSFNVPYLPDIQVRSGYPTNAYETDPRYLMFAERAPNTTRVKDVELLIRYNDYKHDPIAQGLSKNGISSRYDQMEPSASPSSFGAVDAKLTSYQLMFQADKSVCGAWVVNGPTWGDQAGSYLPNGPGSQIPPFDWTAYPNVSHVGQPDLWNFPWVYMDVK